MTDLRFIGDWRFGGGALLAAALAALVFALYRRETRVRRDWLAWGLPALRALAVALVVMMLTGPVLHHRQVIGELARVLLFVDASESMRLADEQMEPARKLFIAHQLGWLPPEKFNAALKQAAAQLAAAQQATVARPGAPSPDPAEVVQNFAKLIEAAAELLARATPEVWSGNVANAARFQNELVTPVRKLLASDAARDARKAARDIAALVPAAAKWEKEIRVAFDAYVARVVTANDPAIAAAFRKFDATPRWQRLDAALNTGERSLLARLAREHNVELITLTGDRADPLWASGAGRLDPTRNLPRSLPSAPTNAPTNLSDPVRERLLALRESEKSAVVLFTDGQHNAGSSPLETAKMLGNRGVPVFTVGLGSPAPPPDLAVLDARGPATIFPDARLQGEITLKDDLRAGQPFTLRIEHGGTVLWEKSLATENLHLRPVPFDFAIKDFVAAELKRRDKDLKFATLPLAFKVSASVLPGEKDTTNNVGTLRTTVITQKPKVLLLDGRPRWEFRYLRNLLERDQRWEVNALLAGGGGEQRPWPRGPLAGAYPGNREQLFSYSLIVWGDLPRQQVKADEIEALREFVEKRGGGLVFIDGRQEGLTNLLTTPLAPLLPVRWQGAPLGAAPVRFSLKATGTSLAPLALLRDPAENAELWRGFPGPHWVAPAQALTGAETLLEAESGPARAAALVFRRYGAGRVLYAAHDESWRWRFNVGDLHHQKFWNQVARWVMEPPFPVEDKFVSLDSGATVYKPGDTAEIRVRIRDAQGALMLRAKAEARLFQNGQRVGTVPLAPDENLGGVYRARTAPLVAGDYEVRVAVEGLPEGEMKAATQFAVVPSGSSEMVNLHCDEPLLRQIAFHSGGDYFREEDIGALADRLKPFSQGKVVESDTVLWRSYWWFTTVVLLLVMEWVLRKRAGML